ncbi:MAG: integrase arm-type DNA-binding domain-containing protein, partial [Balneolaceae bacterium]|nr:integrase arm-type DNA-binding domain-containing protein [Balneolaceae bacterium]
MPKRHLTDQFIRNLTPPDKRTEYYDQHLIEDNTLKGKGVKGLFIRLTEAGSIYFYYRYYFNGNYKSYKVGSYPDLGLSEARDKARELAQKVNEGVDPQAEKNRRKNQPDPETFKAVATEFKEKYLPTLRETTREEYKRIIDVELVPKLGKYPIKEISKNQIISLLDAKAYGKKPAPVMANRIRAR